MKNIFFAAQMFLVFLSGCSDKKDLSLEISNHTDIPRMMEVIQLESDDIFEYLGEFPDNNYPLFISMDDTLASQFIDLDDDGTIDEILIEISLVANETKKVDVLWLHENQYPDFRQKTNIHFAKHENPDNEVEGASRLQTLNNTETAAIYQMEGPAWENNKVGFRNYFDLRNGMDIFGKTTEDMVLDYVGRKDAQSLPDDHNYAISYHELSDWGMDVLKVGNSLGAGSVGMSIEDSLYRIGDNGESFYEKLYEGPLKSSFRFIFPGWEAAGNTYSIAQYVSITANEYCFKSSLYLKNQKNGSFVTGIVNMHSDSLMIIKAGNEHLAFLTLDQQAENNAFLGMALLIKEGSFIESGETKDSGEGITETYYVKMLTEKDKTTEYSFYSFWENSNANFSDPEFIKDYLDLVALKKENPITIRSN